MLVKVNISDVVANVTRSIPRQVDLIRYRQELAAKAREHWIHLAQTRLRSSSRDYVQAISQHSTNDSEVIVLSGRLPNMIEQGFSGGDMRDWMLKGPNAKMGKNGMYNTVPFRHGVPGTGGRNVGEPMPGPIYQAAKKLTATRSRAGGRLSSSGGKHVLHGTRLHPEMRGVSRQVKSMLTTKRKDWHTTSVWTGMQREQKTYRSATQSQYTTFRRISRVRKHPQSWYHPGVKARRFAPKVQERLAELAPFVLQQILGE